MEVLEGEAHSVVLGTRGHAQHGGVASSATAHHRRVYDIINQVATDMSLPVDSAIVAVGTRKLSPVSAKHGVGMLDHLA